MIEFISMKSECELINTVLHESNNDNYDFLSKNLSDR